MAKECGYEAQNLERCNCTYPGCPRHGRCCECLHYHLKSDQLPACCFTEAGEATWDRSFAHFVREQQSK